MNHIEEHILELYVLGSKKVEDKRSEIEAHLRECAGCSVLVDEIRSFYREADADFKTLLQSGGSEKKALAQSRPHVTRREQDFSTQMPAIRSTPIGRLRYFVIKHPVVAGSGVFGFGAVAFAALTLLLNTGTKDINPACVFYNTEQSRVEILNKEQQKLWDFPSPGLIGSRDDEGARRIKKTLVADLDGDGRNEILTILPWIAPSDSVSLSIFETLQHIRFQKGFQRVFNYLDRDYSPAFNPRAILVYQLGKIGTPDILVIALHRERSPSYLARLDSKANVIGELWHFGHLIGIYDTDIDADGRKEIVLVGLNATNDTTTLGYQREFPVIIIIDPTKIVGRKKSVSSPGFDLPFSDAELYYIRLPLSDMSRVRKEGGYVTLMSVPEGNVLKFLVESGFSKDELKPQFDYFFNRNMSVREVKSTNVTDRLHALLVEQGKIKGKLDKKYLDNLKSGVRYWDGKEWRKEVVRVNHDLQLAGGSKK